MTAHFSDEDLRAFLGGQLDDAAMARVEAALDADPELAERAERLLAGEDLDGLLRNAYAPLLAAPVPERLLAALAGPATASVTDLAEARRQRDGAGGGAGAGPAGVRNRASAWRWPRFGALQFGAMAASLAAGLVLGGVFTAGDRTGAGDALALAGAAGPTLPAAVGQMLDTAASGQRVRLARLGEGEVILSFRNVDQALCRQFSITSGAATSDAVACRSAEQWQLEALGKRPAAAGEMRTAGGDAAPAVIAAVDGLIDGDPLEAEDERAALNAR